jgi:hypothetical protein
MGSRMDQGILQAQGIAPPPFAASPSPRPARRAAAAIEIVDESDEEDEEEIRRLEVRPPFLLLLFLCRDDAL